MRRSELHGQGGFSLLQCPKDAELAMPFKVVGTRADIFGMLLLCTGTRMADMIGSSMGGGQDTSLRRCKMTSPSYERVVVVGSQV